MLLNKYIFLGAQPSPRKGGHARGGVATPVRGTPSKISKANPPRTTGARVCNSSVTRLVTKSPSHALCLMCIHGQESSTDSNALQTSSIQAWHSGTEGDQEVPKVNGPFDSEATICTSGGLIEEGCDDLKAACSLLYPLINKTAGLMLQVREISNQVAPEPFRWTAEALLAIQEKILNRAGKMLRVFFSGLVEVCKSPVDGVPSFAVPDVNQAFATSHELMRAASM
eukprot:1159911-Pelagomonas_calceolata.AAC.13